MDLITQLQILHEILWNLIRVNCSNTIFTKPDDFDFNKFWLKWMQIVEIWKNLQLIRKTSGFLNFEGFSRFSRFSLKNKTFTSVFDWECVYFNLLRNVIWSNSECVYYPFCRRPITYLLFVFCLQTTWQTTLGFKFEKYNLK